MYKPICAINCEQMPPSGQATFGNLLIENMQILSYLDSIDVAILFSEQCSQCSQCSLHYTICKICCDHESNQKDLLAKLSFSESAVLPKVLESIYSCGTPRLLLCNILENLTPQGLAWPVSFEIETDKIFRTRTQKLDPPLKLHLANSFFKGIYV